MMFRALLAIISVVVLGSLPQIAFAQDQQPAVKVDRGFLTHVGGSLDLSRVGEVCNLSTIPSTDQKKGVLLHFFYAPSESTTTNLTNLNNFVAKPLLQKPVMVLAIAVGSTDFELEELADQYNFPIIGDPNRKFFQLVATDGVPRTVILNGEGKIMYQHAGYREGRETEWLVILNALNDGKPLPPEFNIANSSGFGQGKASSAGGFSNELGAVDFRGKKAPEVPVEKWINPMPPFSEGKFKLVDFWATWCGPCVKALNVAEDLHAQFDEKLVTIAISDENFATVERMAKQKGWKQPIGIDTQGRAKNEIKMRGIPHAILINPEGTVIWQGHPMKLWGNNASGMKQILGMGK